MAVRKLHAIELIAQLENEDLLTLIEQLLSREGEGDSADWAESLSDQGKADIQEGISDLDAGRSVSYEDFKQEIKKRFP